VLKLGKGEINTQGATKPRLLASAFEALVGALYVDAGFEQTNALVSGWFRSCWDDLLTQSEKDFKTELQEYVQATAKRSLPLYEVVSEQGPAHKKWFRVAVKVGSKVLATGEGKSK